MRHILTELGGETERFLLLAAGIDSHATVVSFSFALAALFLCSLATQSIKVQKFVQNNPVLMMIAHMALYIDRNQQKKKLNKKKTGRYTI